MRVPWFNVPPGTVKKRHKPFARCMISLLGKVKEIQAVSPALTMGLSIVMGEAMALSFRWGEDCADALIRGWVGGGHGAFLSMKWMDAGACSGFVRPSWPVPRRTGVSAIPVVRPVGRNGLHW